MNAPQPLVSVVLPAYNVREHIGEAIRSIHAQHYGNLEIVVVDDGSTDGTADHVGAEFPDVRLFRKANGGAATARNLGMREARGEYVAFLDADDVWLPGKLKAQIDYLDAHPDLGLVCGGFSFWTADADGSFPDPDTLFPPVGEAPPEAENSGWVYHKLLLSNFVWTSTVVMRRALIERIGGYDEKLRLGQDYDYWLRASRETEIHRLGAVMALYRRHDASATARGRGSPGTNHAVEIIQAAVQRWGLASPNGEAISQDELSARLFGMRVRAGYGWYHKGRTAKARNEFREAVKLKPFSLKPWLYLALCALRPARDA
ncbi:glycosyltransferase family 2 protein [Pseudothauera rhizosphaerae]|nr:glycosyltransferase [Pseudothauera rhizosphaerae]